MISEKHLQMYEILGFREKRLTAKEHNAAARHLLACKECRDRLPLPTADEFWICLMGDDLQDAGTKNRTASWASMIDGLSESISDRLVTRKTVFAGSLLIAIVGLLFLMLLPGVSSWNGNLVADVSDSYSPAVLNTESESPNNVNSVTSGTPGKKDSRAGDDKTTKRANVPSRVVPKKQAGRSLLDTRPQTQSATRGETSCGRSLYMNFDARYTEKGLLLTWDKLERAASYNIYLSDLDERLLDHFETDSKTSYLVTEPLDDETFYRLRLIATLDNGERIVSESQNFKIRDLKRRSQSPGLITLRKKTAAAVRCVEVKE